MASGPRSRLKGGMAKVRIAMGLAVLAPLITFAALLLTRNGIVSLDVGLDVLTLQVAQVVAWFALGFAVLSLAMSVQQFRRLGLISIAIVIVCAAVAAAFFVQSRSIAVAGPLDVSTDLTEPPAVPGATGAPVACPGVQAVMTQVAPEKATDALQAAGFSVTESQLFRSRGVRDGFWFGMGHEAVVRIRPGRTDVRVVARYDHTDGGATCKVAAALVAALQAAA
ncbi:DUF1499 domain-containing protein [Brevundimonas sp.]|uniref:DUF1499 domain-containing protein n=1 Tax=Brevundimonas sp. TaxID=1871086 RepID=UPI00286B37EB|nr:DUF1499 domain-containing protein [Brevundimonas sp.]